MFDAKKLLARHRWTVLMLIFLGVFYTFIHWTGQETKRHPLPEASKLRTEKIAPEELKQKEETFQKNLAARPALANLLSIALLSLLLAGLALDLRYLTRLRGSPFRTGALGPRSPWGLSDVLQALVFIFFGEACLVLLEIGVFAVFGVRSISSDLLLMINSLLRDALVVAFIFWVVLIRLKQPTSELGLGRDRWLEHVRTGLSGYVAVLPPLALLFLCLAAGTKFFSYDPEPQNVVQMYLKKSAQPYLIYFTVFVAVLGPVMEEIFFRGFAYRALRGRLGVPAAAVVTAAVFAAFHMNLIAFLPIFLLGLFLGHLYERTGSLVPSITAHVTHNMVMVGLTLGFRTLSG